jgi:hypothetical protein
VAGDGGDRHLGEKVPARGVRHAHAADVPDEAEAAAQRQSGAATGADNDLKKATSCSSTQSHRPELALLMAPGRVKAALVSLLAALHDLLQCPDDAGQIVDEVATVLECRLTRDEIGALLIVLLAAAPPAYVAALGEAVRPRFNGSDASSSGGRPPSRYRSRPLTPEEQRRADDIPSFDLDHDEFMARMCTKSAPLSHRKRAILRLWDSLDPATQRALRPRLVTREVGL